MKRVLYLEEYYKHSKETKVINDYLVMQVIGRYQDMINNLN